MNEKKNPAPGRYGVFAESTPNFITYQQLAVCFGYSKDMRKCAREVAGKLATIEQFGSVDMSAWESTLTVHELRLLWELAGPQQRRAIEDLADVIKRREAVQHE
ncbi:hypothetical protein JY506_03815 [Corynebacterium amycolatum]|uniref:hypothetical protein n=1 Tax=Corynebacterium amycolatum TaxID=43765 RepID=UPI0009771528|nr:hypothetical protein [Corynebacterium amycolatum]MCQ9171455.1 hypothetical protein [Corynebacterium amycolatum]MDC7116945.1 hypothetical protein [Corynebacterium amycolatum]OMQ04782.1 hypothetical protein BXT90_09555 [Corynebacterium amycolatum]